MYKVTYGPHVSFDITRAITLNQRGFYYAIRELIEKAEHLPGVHRISDREVFTEIKHVCEITGISLKTFHRLFRTVKCYEIVEKRRGVYKGQRGIFIRLLST